MRTVVFHGGKGGVGTTFLASEAAALLSSAGGAVVAVDLDLQRGALHYRLDVPLLRDTFTVLDLLPVLDDLSERVLDNALSPCPCGAMLLPAPAAPVDVDAPELFGSLLDALAPRFDHVVVDTPSSLDDTVLAAVAAADLVVLVVTPEIACLGGARRALDRLASENSSTSLSVVVNRSLGDSDYIKLSDIESFLGLPVTIVLTEDLMRCRRAGDESRFLSAERLPLGEGIRAMTRRVFRLD
jgi:Flp pilus assembly CpaE family ATPase